MRHHVSTHPRTPGFQFRKAMEEIGIGDFHISPVLVPWVGSYTCLEDKEASLSPPVANSLFLELASSHRRLFPLYTAESKSDTGDGFGAVFPDLFPSGVDIFTAELRPFSVPVK